MESNACFNRFCWYNFESKKPCLLRYNEYIASDLYSSFPVDEVLFCGKSDLQVIKILKTTHFGKILIMDDKVQSAESDEAIYHESLVHPALLSHPFPKSVFIGGGGEGATAREVLKHKSVETCIMVDVDEVACNMCKEHLPEWNESIWSDKRFHLHCQDALAYLREKKNKYDVIIMDICDPTEAGPGWVLYTKEFYDEVCEKFLNPNGIFVTQSTGCSMNLVKAVYSKINRTLREVFKNVIPYKAEIPSFLAPWGFNMCSNSALLSRESGAESIDLLLKERIGSEEVQKLKFYDGITHGHIFSLTKYERQALEQEDQIFNLEKPFFL